MTADELKAMLDLKPLPGEGGFFKEIFRAPEMLAKSSLPQRYEDERATMTSIFYMLDTSTFSAFHRLKSDEIYHFYLGDPVVLSLIDQSGKLTEVTLGKDIASGHQLHYVVPKLVWQGSRLAPGGDFALMGCTVAPGFEFADYEHGDRRVLLGDHPLHEEIIVALTRSD